MTSFRVAVATWKSIIARSQGAARTIYLCTPGRAGKPC